MIQAEAVEAAAKALRGMYAEICCGPDFEEEARTALEAAIPHILAAKVAEARANNDHIVEGADGYSAGFHYALHCIKGGAE